MCNRETECSVHFRVSTRDRVTDDAVSVVVLDYVGKYAIVTVDNPNYGIPNISFASLMGQPIPEMFVTTVLDLKDEETTVGAIMGDVELWRDSKVFEEFFTPPLPEVLQGLNPFDGSITEEQYELGNNLLTDALWSAHDLVVSGVREGLVPAL